MSALKFARQAFADKPHSSVSDWIDILTKNDHTAESYDGIPELVDAIDLQGTAGSAEASRALRKKLKHGNAHQQYRALVILKALVDNCGEKFRKIFQDGHLTDALRNLAGDVDADKRVRKKLLLVLSAWDEQYKGDPNMHFVAGIVKQYGGGIVRRPATGQDAGTVTVQEVLARVDPPPGGEEEEKKKKKKVEMSKSERAKAKKDQKKGPQGKRVPFDFERDKEAVMQSIVEGSQASSNLVNAITLVNRKTDSLQENERVQECLEQAKKVKTQIVRYIRLVESEDIIGTLIETNDRLMTSIEMYDRLSLSDVDPDPQSTELAKAMAATHLAAHATNGSLISSADHEGENGKSTLKSTTATPYIHPDLEDLTFGPVRRANHNGLPAPIKPSIQFLSDEDEYEDRLEHRVSLAEFSDYESSDEETHNNRANAGPSRRNYVTVSDDEDDDEFTGEDAEDDPFADPFADGQHSVLTRSA